MISLELYRIFALVAKEMNITTASEILYISQPAVSKHIKNLEQQLGERLFKRTSTGLEFTDVGKNLYDQIKPHIEALNKIENGFISNKELSISVHISMYEMLSKSFSTFHLNHGNIILNINSNNLVNMLAPDIAEMLNALENEKTDVVISKKLPEYNNSKIEFIKLGDLQDILICSPNSKYCDKIVDSNLLNKVTILLPKKNSVTSQNFFHITQIDENLSNIQFITYKAMLDIIKQKDCICLVTQEYIAQELMENNVCKLNTDFVLPKLEYGAYINKNNVSSELKSLIKFLKES